MINITYPITSIFHSLTHFTSLSSSTEEDLIEGGYTKIEISTQLNGVGSKFSSTFAKSPQEVIEILKDEHSASFINIKFDDDNKCRLSFEFNSVIGTSQVVKISDLTSEERKNIVSEIRNGKVIYKTESNRLFYTTECHLILNKTDNEIQFWTLFPGALAPPLPAVGEETIGFWKEHIFITSI